MADARKLAPTPMPEPAKTEQFAAPREPKWRRYGTPVLVLLLAAAVVFTITRNWNSWKAAKRNRLPTTLTFAAT